MTKYDYIIGIFKLITKMNTAQVRLVFEYAHKIFVEGIEFNPAGAFSNAPESRLFIIFLASLLSLT